MTPDTEDVASLDDLAALLRTTADWDEELGIVEALNDEPCVDPTSVLSMTGEWNDPYLTLEITHSDRREVLSVTHGDGYTKVVAPGVEYDGYLDARSRIDVITGVLQARTSYVRHTRLGFGIRHDFEVAGREGELLGSAQPKIGVVPLFLRLMPFLPESVETTCLLPNTSSADTR